MIFDTITAISPQVKAGSLRGIAVTTTKRSGLYPEIPTIAESAWRATTPRPGAEYSLRPARRRRSSRS
jgi:tripartite-type tricarboxylate transporter receptor subunit TctC